MPCFLVGKEKFGREGPGYEHDERARPGLIRDRRRWRKQEANRTAAVESPKERASETPEDFRAPQRARSDNPEVVGSNPSPATI